MFGRRFVDPGDGDFVEPTHHIEAIMRALLQGPVDGKCLCWVMLYVSLLSLSGPGLFVCVWLRTDGDLSIWLGAEHERVRMAWS